MEHQTFIRLYEDEGDGFTFNREEYDLGDFGGHLPVAGDLIISPGVRVGLNRNEPTNRTVFEVVTRYFAPGARNYGRTYVCFVVKPRAGTYEEANIL